MRSTSPNFDALDAMLTFVEANPDLHRQGVWRDHGEPGAGCAAHHLAMGAGAEYIMDTPGDPRVPQYMYAYAAVRDTAPGWAIIQDLLGGGRRYQWDDVVTPDGRVMAVAAYATEVAGLSVMQASVLFSGGQTVARMRCLVEGWRHEEELAGHLRRQAVRAHVRELAIAEALGLTPLGHSSHPAGAGRSHACDTARTSPGRGLGYWDQPLA